MTHVPETRTRNSRAKLVCVSYRLAARYFSRKFLASNRACSISCMFLVQVFGCQFLIRVSRASTMGLTLTITSSGTTYCKTKLHHFQAVSGTGSRAFKDLVCFQGFSRPRQYFYKPSTFKNRQEPCVNIVNGRIILTAHCLSRCHTVGRQYLPSSIGCI